MSAVTPEPPPSLMTPASPAAPVAANEPRADLLAGVPEAALADGASRRSRHERRAVNTLAVAALILAVLLSPLAALFGHIAAGQISRSNGRERGVVIAWISVGLGYLWLVGAIIIGVVIWNVLTV